MEMITEHSALSGSDYGYFKCLSGLVLKSATSRLSFRIDLTTSISPVRSLVRVCGVLLCLVCTAEATAAGWEFQHGEDNELCVAMRERLNKLTVSDLDKYPNNSCAATGALSYPDFKEPPWQELDAKQHEALVYKLMRFLNLGSVDYFSRARPGRSDKWAEMSKGQQENFDQQSLQSAREFIARGGRVLLWRTRLVEDFRITNHPYAALGPQTIIQLRYPDELRAENSQACPELSRTPYFPSYLFFVTDDLSGPDPRVGYTSDGLFGSVPMLLDGRPIFLDGAGANVITLGWDEGSGPTDFCELYYD